MTKLREFRMKVAGLERHFYFDPPFDLEDRFEDTVDGQRKAIESVLVDAETFGIVLEQDDKAVAIDVRIDYTIRGSVNVAIDLDEPMEPDLRTLEEFASTCDDLIRDAIVEEVRYGNCDVDFDDFFVEEAVDEHGNGLDLF